MKNKYFCVAACLIIAMQAYAADKLNYYRIFWNPTLHGQYLDYCMHDKSGCGKGVADRYCKQMGYERSDKFVKANNVGLTNYIDKRFRCKGWTCDGFKHIQCVAKIKHDPAEDWHYRYAQFVYPRYDNYRLDWCYDGEKGCGRRAAYAYCRQLGYMDVKSYKIQKPVASTKSIGNQKLCFKNACKGFAVINCKR